MCVTIAETDRLDVVPVSTQPLATTLVTSSCTSSLAMLTPISDTRWVMPDSTMSADHTSLTAEVFLQTNGCKRNNEVVIRSNAHASYQ